MRNLFRRLRSANYRHWICLALLLGSGALTAFRYRYSVLRAGQAFRDLAYSLRYYAVYLFTSREMPVTVTALPSFDLSHFVSFSVDDLQRKFAGMWALIFDGETLLDYLAATADSLHGFTVFLLCVLPLGFLIPVLRSWLVKPCDDLVGEVRPSVRRFQRCVERPVRAVVSWLCRFYSFLRPRPWCCALLLIWAVNLNAVTMTVEFLAFYFYFVMSLDFLALSSQLVKLLIDAIVMFTGAPLVFWLTLAVILTDRWRRKIGFARLDRFERKNREFLQSQPLVLMVTGSMGKRKTTLLTDMAVTEEIHFRDRALELMLEQFAKYPDFPFANLENELKRAVRHHQVYNLTTARAWAGKKEERFRRDPCAAKLYGYDIDRHRLEYDDNLSVSPITAMIADYVCLFFIYTVQSSLLVSNYSIRTDGVLLGDKHFPIWDSELFRRKPTLAHELSRHAHILDYDILRLGKKLIAENPAAGSFEFGVVPISEVGKERGNNLVLQEIRRNTEDANQKNDLFNNYLKMCRHPATVANFPFIRILTVETEDGTMDGEKTEHQYYLSSKKIYSDRFATDCFRGYFEKRNEDCTEGLEDCPSYGTTRATIDELHGQHSYFIRDMETLSSKVPPKPKPQTEPPKKRGKRS